MTQEEFCEKLSDAKCCLAEKAYEMTRKIRLGLCIGDLGREVKILTIYTTLLQCDCMEDEDQCLDEDQLNTIFAHIDELCVNCC